ncbi:MAG TPA: 8-oxo-dGTP diphosphatase MutT [Thiolinea sp.]|nr:8-oxo-dGTP diphosphatase MutT [Thiolinea sp.]
MLNTEANMLVEASWIHVVAAVIYNSRQQILLAQRPLHKHQGGKWEFPGGKVEANETATLALKRELFEELGIIADISAMQPLLEIKHAYSDKNIWLDVWIVPSFQNDALGREGQLTAWFNLEDLKNLDFPAANEPILTKLLAQSS